MIPFPPMNALWNCFIESLTVLQREREDIEVLLLAMTQGKLSMAEYTLEFHTLAAGSEWNEPALKAVFCQELNAEVLTEPTY